MIDLCPGERIRSRFILGQIYFFNVLRKCHHFFYRKVVTFFGKYEKSIFLIAKMKNFHRKTTEIP